MRSVWAIAMPNQEATTVSRAMLQWISIFGIPEEIQADGAANMKAAIAALKHLTGCALDFSCPLLSTRNDLRTSLSSCIKTRR